jgi:hypothetical protein
MLCNYTIPYISSIAPLYMKIAAVLCPSLVIHIDSSRWLHCRTDDPRLSFGRLVLAIKTAKTGIRAKC